MVLFPPKNQKYKPLSPPCDPDPVRFKSMCGSEKNPSCPRKVRIVTSPSTFELHFFVADWQGVIMYRITDLKQQNCTKNHQ